MNVYPYWKICVNTLVRYYTMNIHKDFQDFLKSLNDEGVEFVIIGGYAVAFHGYIRNTGDLDIFFRNISTNIQKIKKALISFGFNDQSIELGDFYKLGNIIRMGIAPIRIEMLNDISGTTFDEVWSSRVHGLYDDVPVNYIGLKELLSNKKASGRPKYLLDVEELDASKQQ